MSRFHKASAGRTPIGEFWIDVTHAKGATRLELTGEELSGLVALLRAAAAEPGPCESLHHRPLADAEPGPKLSFTPTIEESIGYRQGWPDLDKLNSIRAPWLASPAELRIELAPGQGVIVRPRTPRPPLLTLTNINLNAEEGHQAQDVVFDAAHQNKLRAALELVR